MSRERGMKQWYAKRTKELEEKEKMAEPTQSGLSAEQLQELLTKVIQEVRKPSAKEEREERDAAAQELRRKQMIYHLGKAEEEAARNKKNSCSHQRGDDGFAGQTLGRYTTQGQVHADDTISLICTRCGTTWRWKGTPQERDLSINGAHGLMGYRPPDESKCLQACPHCNQFVENKEYAAHEPECKAKIAALVV